MALGPGDISGVLNALVPLLLARQAIAVPGAFGPGNAAKLTALQALLEAQITVILARIPGIP